MGIRPRHVAYVSLVLWASLFAPGLARGQDLEPRAFSPVPVGLNFVLVGYGYSSGNVLFDPSVPIEDAQGKLHTAFIAYVHSLEVLGTTAKLGFVLPHAWGDWDGLVEGEHRSTYRRGFGDPALQFAVNFVGAPAVSLEEMRSYREGTIVGASLLVMVPVGQYDASKLVNLGSNRWAIRPRVGVSHRTGRWTLEAIASVRFFTPNGESILAERVTQEPLWGASANLIHEFRRGFWMGLGVGKSWGARTVLDGVGTDTYQRNTKFGGTLVLPMGVHSSLKLTYVDAASTRRGTDYDTLSLAYQVRWGAGL